jgi:poly-gamma-glutamate capsule biosynthesis protein CapA/YwtB (metallophosphatase superfamily)
MAVTIALAGDTMLGRGVADRLRSVRPSDLFAPDVVALAREADALILNLECCISDRGTPWSAPGKPFFFRAPPVAVEALTHLGVRCVTLGNNHALDFGAEALADTLEHLDAAGIAHVGAGPDEAHARAPARFEVAGLGVAVIGLSDHPADFAAGTDEPGIAYADLRTGVPGWVTSAIELARADVVIVTPHWGPNMTSEPVPDVRSAARTLREAGATLVAGHSAHVFHGTEARVLFDLGDFLDDYAVDPQLRNDLGGLFLVSLDGNGPGRLEVVPLKLDYCFTRLARGDDRAWIARRFTEACRALGTEVVDDGERLIVGWG